MMQSSEERRRRDSPDALNCAKNRRVLPQREVGLHNIVVGSVCPNDAAQVRFAEHDDVVEALAAIRSDESLDVTVLPRRAGTRRSPVVHSAKIRDSSLRSE